MIIDQRALKVLDVLTQWTGARSIACLKSENSAIGLFKKKKTLIFSTKYKSLEDRSDYKIIF